MKANQIKQWTPMIIIIAMTLFGVMSCTTSPTSSEPVESATFEMQASQTNAGNASTDEPELSRLTGYLRASTSGDCLFLVVSPSEIYELWMSRQLRATTMNQLALVVGFIPDNVIPVCSDYPVLVVKKLIILSPDPQHNG
jgi:hypothetical protein